MIQNQCVCAEFKLMTDVRSWYDSLLQIRTGCNYYFFQDFVASFKINMCKLIVLKIDINNNLHTID